MAINVSMAAGNRWLVADVTPQRTQKKRVFSKDCGVLDGGCLFIWTRGITRFRGCIKRGLSIKDLQVYLSIAFV